MVDPKLGELQDNGGSTQTIALLEDSPAIDAGSNPNNLETDQRGQGFNRNSGGLLAGGIYNSEGGTVTLTSSLLASNGGSANIGDISGDGEYISGGNNLISRGFLFSIPSLPISLKICYLIRSHNEYELITREKTNG